MANDNPENFGENLAAGLPGIEFILGLLGMGKKAPVSNPSAPALPPPVAAPVYRDSAGRPYNYPVDAAGKPLR